MIQGIWSSVPYQKILMDMVICKCLEYQTWLKSSFEGELCLSFMHVDMVGMGMKDLMGMKCGIMREKVVRGMEYG